MKDSPNIVRVASLVGDNARAAMLNALLSGEALTASELAREAGITPQTASSHLSKLREGGLINSVSAGRHRYFRLAADDVARLLEGLMGVAQRTGARKVKTGPRDPAMRRSRVCYDHLAGDIGVEIYDSFVRNKLIRISDQSNEAGGVIALTRKGQSFCEQHGMELATPAGSRRPICRPCLDWSVRKFHLAGSLGVEILKLCYGKKWAKRIDGSRVVNWTPSGEKKLREAFQLD